MLALIVTGDGKAACREIDRVADRGSTILQGRGGYGGQPKDVVLCACSNKQLYEIEHAVRAIDPGCFIIMLQSNEVQGEGFRRLELGKSEEKQLKKKTRRALLLRADCQKTLKSVTVGGHAPTTATPTGEFCGKLCARSFAPSARFAAKFCRRGIQRAAEPSAAPRRAVRCGYRDPLN